MACASPIECNTIQESPCDIWYLDSGCRNHMTGNLNLFSSLDNLVQTDVTLGNNVQVIILGKCSVGILTKQGERMFMPDVYCHVPNPPTDKEDVTHILIDPGYLAP